MGWRRRRRGIACPELVELVTAYLDGALAAAELARVAAHLEHCEDCTTYVAQFARTVTALGELPAPEEPADEVLDTLLTAFRERACGR
jgi:anti-sigma factor RsiW